MSWVVTPRHWQIVPGILKYHNSCKTWGATSSSDTAPRPTWLQFQQHCCENLISLMNWIFSVPKSIMSPSSETDVVRSAHITLMLTVAVFKTKEVHSILTWLIAKEDNIAYRQTYSCFTCVVVCLYLSCISHYKRLYQLHNFSHVVMKTSYCIILVGSQTKTSHFVVQVWFKGTTPILTL
jgi:hypothetical protein